MLSNAYFLAKFRIDTAENDPAKNLQKFAKIYPAVSKPTQRPPGTGAPASAAPGAAPAPSRRRGPARAAPAPGSAAPRPRKAPVKLRVRGLGLAKLAKLIKIGNF